MEQWHQHGGGDDDECNEDNDMRDLLSASSSQELL